MAKKKTTKKTSTRKKGSQIAATLYTLREHLKTPKDIAKTLKRVRKIGYENVQISGVGPVEPTDLRKMMDDAGVKCIGAHIGLDAFREDIVDVIDKLHVWGSEYVAIPWLPWQECATPAAWKKMAREFVKYGKETKKEGVTLQYHNHAFEFQRYKGKTGLEILYDAADPKYLQAELDLCWVVRGGADPADWCLRMKGRLDQVHMKDTVMLDNQPVFAEVGAGNINWKPVLAACKKAKTKYYIVEQDACPITEDPFKSIRISYENMREMGLK